MLLARCAPALRPSTALVTSTRIINRPFSRESLGISHLLRHGAGSGSSKNRRIHESAAPGQKRPSPYRLLQPHTFLAAFAPLHVSGWRLDTLSTEPVAGAMANSGTTNLRLEEGMDDLQGRRLVRLYRFPEGREGWSSLMSVARHIGDAAAEQNHHPTMNISPATISAGAESSSAGYVLEVSTHTHTPMPPLRVSIPSDESEATPAPTAKMRPGVTGKDTKLAESIEEGYRIRTGGVPA